MRNNPPPRTLYRGDSMLLFCCTHTVVIKHGKWNYAMIWRGMIWHDTTRHDTTRHDMTWHDMTWHDLTWPDLTWPDLPWPDLTWPESTKNQCFLRSEINPETAPKSIRNRCLKKHVVFNTFLNILKFTSISRPSISVRPRSVSWGFPIFRFCDSRPFLLPKNL